MAPEERALHKPEPPRITPGRRSRARTPLLTLTDQVCSSAANWLLLVLVARAVDVAQFGVFAAMFGLLALGLAIQRAALGVPLGTDSASPPSVSLKTQVGSGSAVAIGLGTAVGLLTCGGAYAFSDDPLPLLILAIASPWAVTQDYWRFAGMALARPGIVLTSDAIWLGCLVMPLGVGLATDLSIDSSVYVGSWLIGAILATLAFTLTSMDIRPRMFGLRSLLRERRRWHLAGDGLLAAATPILVSVVVGTTVAASALGALRGAATLLSPVNVLIATVPLAVLPAAAKRREGEVHLVITVTAALLAFVLVCGFTLWLLPASWGHMLLGDTWDTARPLVPIVALEFAGVALWNGALTVLRLRRGERRALKLRVGYVVLTFTAVLLLTGLSPSAGSAAIASAGSALLLGVMGWKTALTSARPQ